MSKGGGPWDRACAQNFAQAEKACNQKGGNVAACMSAAQERQRSCMQAAANSAAQHNQPGTIIPDPNGTTTPSTNSCQVFLARNTAYCTNLAKTGGAVAAQACMTKAREADNSCKSDMAKGQAVEKH